MATDTATRRIIIIDGSVPDLQTLLDGVGADAAVFVLDPDEDGVQQIVGILAANDLSDLSAIQIVSHGSEGSITLGSAVLDQGNIASYADALAQIGDALAPGGDLMLYGCDVAGGTTGQQFIDDLAELTGANVAASTDATGAAALGGDWTLEASTGPIETSAPVTADAQANFDGLLANETFTVNQTTVLTTDIDSDGQIDPGVNGNPGDTVTTTVTIANNSTTPTPVDATGVTFSETLIGMTIVNQPGNDVNVSPIAFNDSYTAIGNTLLEVGNATSQTGPQKSVAGHVTDNDTEFFGDTFTISAFDATSANGGTVTMITSGADMGSFTYVSAANFTGTDTFTYTIRDKGLDGLANTADDLTSVGTVTITVANQVWYVDANAAGGTGTSTNPFNSLASVSGGADLDDAGDIIFVRAGNYTTGVALENSQTLWGEGEALVVNGFNLLAAGGDAVIDPVGSVGVTLATHNTLKGFTVEDTTTDISGSDVGNLTISNVNLTNSGRLVNLTTGASGGSVNVTFDQAVSTGTPAGNAGASLTNLVGSITFNNAAISNTAGTGVGFDVSGGTANIDYNGTITETNNARTISVVNKTGGTVSFDGAISSTGSADGIFLNSNTGATFAFTGTLTLNTSASGTAGFTATGGGTVPLPDPEARSIPEPVLRSISPTPRSALPT
jgi:hypothetical protein